jgi:hypothetical protein
MSTRGIAFGALALAAASCSPAGPSSAERNVGLRLDPLPITAIVRPCPVPTPCPPPVTCPAPPPCPSGLPDASFHSDFSVILEERRGMLAHWESLIIEVIDRRHGRTAGYHEYHAELLRVRGVEEIPPGQHVRFAAFAFFYPAVSDPDLVIRVAVRVRWNDGQVSEVTAEGIVRLP